MTWLQRYHIINYFKSSIWILPSLSMIVAMAAVRTLNAIEIKLGWIVEFDPATSMTVMGTLAASMFTLIVFVCSALLISVQLASASLTPRFIGLVFRNPVTKYSLTLFMFTFTFTLGALLRIRVAVPLITAYVAVYSCVLSLGVFIYLVDEVGRKLRPSGAMKLTAKLGRDVIRNVYPRLISEPKEAARVPVIPSGEPERVILNRREGVLLAFDIKGLVSLARQNECVIELVPQVGDFISAGQPLFRIFCNGRTPSDFSLYQSIAVGAERTMEQDPGFAFRILVDIASKGLSPAINDPTTAVLAIDQIQYLLRHLGSRRLDEGLRLDETGTLRLIYRTPDWEDYVALAVTEVRQFGGTSIQIARRLKAMCENLIQTLPEERAAVLRTELSLIERSTRRNFPESEDQAMADVSDFQGVGGKKEK
ncbi:MAG: DUF2254 domain-containing protein [Bacteroidetes bacterium]|nr:DUF2254 domain-containing protein [Bacteroidota bacterium]